LKALERERKRKNIREPEREIEKKKGKKIPRSYILLRETDRSENSNQQKRPFFPRETLGSGPTLTAWKAGETAIVSSMALCQ
jgi:hypothetical protein